MLYFNILSLDPDSRKEEYYKPKNELKSYFPPKYTNGNKYGFSPKEETSDKVNIYTVICFSMRTNIRKILNTGMNIVVIQTNWKSLNQLPIKLTHTRITNNTKKLKESLLILKA
jgi:hypothetical protein